MFASPSLIRFDVVWRRGVLPLRLLQGDGEGFVHHSASFRWRELQREIMRRFLQGATESTCSQPVNAKINKRNGQEVLIYFMFRDCEASRRLAGCDSSRLVYFFAFLEGEKSRKK